LVARLACAGIATCALAGLAAAAAAEPKYGNFVAYDAGKFTIVTSRGEQQVRDLMLDLAQFQLTLEAMLRTKTQDTGIPTHIFIVNGRQWQQYLQPRAGVGGVFLPRRFANYLLINGDSDRALTLRIIFHEYTHFFIRSQFAGEYPPWFDEGMAELLGMARFRGDTALFDVAVDRVLDARAGEWIPFDRLLKIENSSPEYQSHNLARGFYGQAWLTVHFGKVADAEFGAHMFAYLKALNQLVPPDVAARDAFGNDLAAVDQQLRAYSRRKGYNVGSIRIGTATPLTMGAGRPLGDVETLTTIADVMLEMRLAPDRIRPLIETVSTLDPASVQNALLTIRLANQAGDDALFQRSLAALTPLLAADDWRSRKVLGTVLLDRFNEGDADRLTTPQGKAEMERALQWFDEALTHNPGDVESLWGYGSAATYLNKELYLAETRLQAAYMKVPGSADIALALANLYGVKGEPQRMIPLLEDVIRLATQLPMREWAKDTLIKTRAFIEQQYLQELNERKQQKPRRQ
jgi:tetratricopeptide (TPR) repeat protein